MRERALRSLVHIRDALPRMCVHEGSTDGECVHIFTCMCVCVCVCVFVCGLLFFRPHALAVHYVCFASPRQIELKTGEQYRGMLKHTEDNWNCQMEDVTYTARVRCVKA